jgi:release factor glutamine methyltransferase
LNSEPWTIGKLLTWTQQFLEKKGADSPRLDAEVLLAHALGCKRIQLYTRFDEEPGDDVRQRFRELVKRRAEGCPVAYLTGVKEFYSLTFEVTPAVLIPRSDTETLVVECLKLAKDLASPTILDLCTGSGIIAVALAKHHQSAQLTATDISPEALAISQRNATRQGVTDRVAFVQGDLFAPLVGREPFDLIASNPPYIPSADCDKLEPTVRNFEPRLALDGGADGFVVVDRILADARAFLKPGGSLLLEINAEREAATRARIGAISGYELARTIHDRAGQPRVLRARWIGQASGVA